MITRAIMLKSGQSHHRETIFVKTFLIALTSLMLLSAVFSSVKASPEDESFVVADAMRWLSLIDEERYPESWRAASVLLRSVVREAQWGAAISAMRNPLGKRSQREVVGTKQKSALPGVPDGQYLIITTRVSFEYKQKATETVTFVREPDGAWRAAGYFIR